MTFLPASPMQAFWLGVMVAYSPALLLLAIMLRRIPILEPAAGTIATGRAPAPSIPTPAAGAGAVLSFSDNPRSLRRKARKRD